jgi:hypothetical protein
MPKAFREPSTRSVLTVERYWRELFGGLDALANETNRVGPRWDQREGQTQRRSACASLSAAGLNTRGPS